MHVVTAPGSVRGAVDFIPIPGPYCNVADSIIVGTTVSLLVAIVAAGSSSQEAVPSGSTPVTRRRPRAPVRAGAAGLCLVVGAVLGTAAAVNADNRVGRHAHFRL